MARKRTELNVLTRGRTQELLVRTDLPSFTRMTLPHATIRFLAQLTGDGNDLRVVVTVVNQEGAYVRHQEWALTPNDLGLPAVQVKP